MSILARLFPLFGSLQGHTSEEYKQDLVAGITVGIMLVPQGMAYAFLAGMPPIYGLYSGLIPLMIYALLGTSRQLSLGPVAVSSLLVLGGVSQIETPGTTKYIQLVILAGLFIGLAQVLMGILRLGKLVNLLPQPVIAGFTSAAAIIIAVSQLKDFLGIKIPVFSKIHETALYALSHIGESNWIAILMCISAILTMLVLKRVNKRIPGALIVVLAGTSLSWAFGLDQYGLAIVKSVPSGLPAFSLPGLNTNDLLALVPVILTVSVIGVVECFSIAKVLEAKHNDYKVNANQELYAIGISKIGGAFFQSIPTSASFTRSAINNEAGAKSGLASLITALLVVLTLLFFTEYFFYLPKAILAAIILMAVKSLFDYKEAVSLWHKERPCFWLMMITFVATLVLGIQEGVATGIIVAIIMHLLNLLPAKKVLPPEGDNTIQPH